MKIKYCRCNKYDDNWCHSGVFTIGKLYKYLGPDIDGDYSIENDDGDFLYFIIDGTTFSFVNTDTPTIGI